MDKRVLGGVAVLAIFGGLFVFKSCTTQTEEGLRTETPASQAAIAEAVSQWTPEKVEAFRIANERARKGLDEEPGYNQGPLKEKKTSTK